MPEPVFVTVATAPDLAAANVLRGALEGEEIECFIPDEQVAGAMWHLSGAIGGVRLQIRAADEARAREVLDSLGAAPGDLAESDDVSSSDRAAAKALRVALIGFFLWPLVHPYALSLAVRSTRDASLSKRGRGQARVALGISLASLAGFFLVLYLLLAK
jgi:hypothetical protein